MTALAPVCPRHRDAPVHDCPGCNPVPPPSPGRMGENPWVLCAQCGPDVCVDEDGCCRICGADALQIHGKGNPYAALAEKEKEVEALKREVRDTVRNALAIADGGQRIRARYDELIRERDSALARAERAEAERDALIRDQANGTVEVAALQAEVARLREALETIQHRLEGAHHTTIRINGRDEDGGWIHDIAREALTGDEDAALKAMEDQAGPLDELDRGKSERIGQLEDEIRWLKLAATAFIEKFDRMEFARDEMNALKKLVDPGKWGG